MRRLIGCILVTGMLLVIGCELRDIPHTINNPQPPTPIVPVAPATSYFKGLAAWNDAHLIESPSHLASLLNELVKAKMLTTDDVGKVAAAFPKMAGDSREMTPADSKTLLNLK